MVEERETAGREMIPRRRMNPRRKIRRRTSASSISSTHHVLSSFHHKRRSNNSSSRNRITTFPIQGEGMEGADQEVVAREGGIKINHSFRETIVQMDGVAGYHLPRMIIVSQEVRDVMEDETTGHVLLPTRMFQKVKMRPVALTGAGEEEGDEEIGSLPMLAAVEEGLPVEVEEDVAVIETAGGAGADVR